MVATHTICIKVVEQVANLPRSPTPTSLSTPFKTSAQVLMTSKLKLELPVEKVVFQITFA
jgi:hypothetical protein